MAVIEAALGARISKSELARRVGGLSTSIESATGEDAMASTEYSRNARSPRMRIHPSETEVAQLIQEAAQQYEECMRLADLDDISDRVEISHPKYAWDNPIGLVVTESSNAELVWSSR